ncbi:MAG TPA: GTP diphosphokinase [Gammaproteobacteria bacterium]|nr:GTP diphosphokinase [Gammaproteobacteria bacterium]
MGQSMDNVASRRAGSDELDLEGWLARVTAGLPEQEQSLVRRAAQRARQAHGSQKRASGEPYLQHVLAVADILNDLRMDHETLAAALLHDTVEDTGLTLDFLREEFGPVVARLVDGVTKMGQISGYGLVSQTDAKGREQDRAESLRKLLLAMVDDVRVVLIKLADRLHNVRTLRYLDPARQRRIAQETLDIYAPLANRLGIGQIKWELEDLSLRYLEPETYREIARLLAERRDDRERYIQDVVNRLRSELQAAGVEGAEVTGRPKHIYSIWRKMSRKNVDFHQIFDVRAVRILVNQVADCYAALGVVHSLWRYIPREFDDYIANPKDNLYRSLHTAVMGPEGKTLEIQIRTLEMHQHAELGVAAHWRYKEGSRQRSSIDSKITWMRQLLEWRDEEPSARAFVDRFKSETGTDRVYVLTPRGEVVDLAQGATPLDFAYAIHTDIGHRCRGAKINGRIVPLTYELHSGDQVEVLATRQNAPSRDWLNPELGYLRTPRARAKVRHWFKQQDRDKNVAAGRAALDRELHRLGISELSLDRLVQRFHANNPDDLLAAIGAGDITSAQIAGAAHELTAPPAEPAEELPRTTGRPAARARAPEGLRIEGVGNLVTHLARCCKPVPEDPVVGYVTRGRGVTIHRSDCPNILRLSGADRERLLEVDWGGGERQVYPVDVEVQAYDRQGLLRDISAILANEKVNVMGVNTVTSKHDYIARMDLSLEISDIGQLSRVLGRISQLPNVLEARRRA